MTKLKFLPTTARTRSITSTLAKSHAGFSNPLSRFFYQRTMVFDSFINWNIQYFFHLTIMDTPAYDTIGSSGDIHDDRTWLFFTMYQLELGCRLFFLIQPISIEDEEPILNEYVTRKQVMILYILFPFIALIE